VSVPVQGYCVNFTAAGLGAAFIAVGPLSEGAILRRIRVFWSAEAATTLAVGLALGGVPEASQAAYEAASALIFPGAYVRAGKPAVGVLVGAAGQGWFDVPCGVEIYSGSRYVLGFVGSGLAEADVSVVLAVECVKA